MRAPSFGSRHVFHVSEDRDDSPFAKHEMEVRESGWRAVEYIEGSSPEMAEWTQLVTTKAILGNLAMLAHNFALV